MTQQHRPSNQGGRPPKLSAADVRELSRLMSDRDTCVQDVAADFGISRAAIYKYVSPRGEIRARGRRVLDRATPEGGL
ncbi:helix-turn-helix domain-containing protein [Thiolapillus sp.]|uniref:helix-turn-helix domain-containing protein n=1 Tax=Thiolapillus sp. TaxID=2017437 RepID=UPI003AF6F542